MEVQIRGFLEYRQMLTQNSSRVTRVLTTAQRTMMTLRLAIQAVFKISNMTTFE